LRCEQSRIHLKSKAPTRDRGIVMSTLDRLFYDKLFVLRYLCMK